ncbi:BF3164 family lipoprotein [Bacteroides helcogenes]|uniref:Lipoprotein n=1 Tax=Bacteroides helcogenes (strain ATCC 35417 / DSM 20613 / JCM 6297 / CCUG 15421 / P 36-108) TaxID=693979 RepID=E6SUI3_BACT6|nr:BF3164 family lipoprotein [Bacteroides helcogenes]ADV43347.1 putative lipoprotein [Bacteroides helcogenes P 36-108]MDY5238115.1 BF3164 family lipoprotein [Bacteroides helcogenes]
MKTFISILLLLTLLAACTTATHEKGLTYTDFPETKELSASVQPLDTALFRYPFRIRVQGDRAIVMDLHGQDYYFHLFHYPDFRYQSSFGKRGDSPEEMVSAENVRWNGNSLWALDANKSELTRFGLDLSGDSLLRLEAVSLDKDILRALDFVMYDDSTFIIPDYSGDNRLCWVNRQGKLLRKMGEIPSSNKNALENARPALAQAWRSFIDYNPRNGVLAAVTQLGEVLEVYNLKDSTHAVWIGPGGEPEFQISQGYGLPTGIMGFSDVQVTDSAVYAVFHGRTFKEIAQSAQKSIELPDGGQYIYVFSLKGEPLRKYVLDHYVYGISVDEEKGIILTTDVNKDEPIIEYKLNK